MHISPISGGIHFETGGATDVVLFCPAERVVAVQLQTHRIGVVVRLVIREFPAIGQQAGASGIGRIPHNIWFALGSGFR